MMEDLAFNDGFWDGFDWDATGQQVSP